MKLEFDLLEKTFTPENGNAIKYYVLSRQLVDGSTIEIPLKGEKAKLLNMSLKLENKR